MQSVDYSARGQGASITKGDHGFSFYSSGLDRLSDVCLEAEASPRGSLEAENLLPRPRLDVLLPWLGLASPRDYCLGLASVSSMRKISSKKT